MSIKSAMGSAVRIADIVTDYAIQPFWLTKIRDITEKVHSVVNDFFYESVDPKKGIALAHIVSGYYGFIEYALLNIDPFAHENPSVTRFRSRISAFFAEYIHASPITKVIFLDVDETLRIRNQELIEKENEECNADPVGFLQRANGPLDPNCIVRIKKILDAHPDVAIVFSTAWRVGRSPSVMRTIFPKEFADRIYDKTVDQLEPERKMILKHRYAPQYAPAPLQYTLQSSPLISTRYASHYPIALAKIEPKYQSKWNLIKNSFLSRSLEIFDWLEHHPEVNSYVILDDLFLENYKMLSCFNPEENHERRRKYSIFGGRFIKMDPTTLLSEQNGQDAIGVLKVKGGNGVDIYRNH